MTYLELKKIKKIKKINKLLYKNLKYNNNIEEIIINNNNNITDLTLFNNNSRLAININYNNNIIIKGFYNIGGYTEHNINNIKDLKIFLILINKLILFID